MAGKRIGSLWVTKKASAAKLSGTIDFLGVPIRIIIVENKDDNRKDSSPSYHVISYGVDLQKKKTDPEPEPPLPPDDLF